MDYSSKSMEFEYSRDDMAQSGEIPPESEESMTLTEELNEWLTRCAAFSGAGRNDGSGTDTATTGSKAAGGGLRRFHHEGRTHREHQSHFLASRGKGKGNLRRHDTLARDDQFDAMFKYSQKILADQGSEPLRDPSHVPLPLYVRTQLRALRFSLENGFRYHEAFEAHAKGLNWEKAVELHERQKVGIARFGTGQESPRSAEQVLELRKTHVHQVKARLQVAEAPLKQWYESQIDLRRTVKTSTSPATLSSGIDYRDDVFAIVAKKWSLHVATVRAAEVWIEALQKDRELQSEKRKALEERRRQAKPMTIQQRARYWQIVRRKLREYVLRYKRRRCGGAVKLISRFLAQLGRIRRICASIPEFRRRVILVQRQVRRFLQCREARRVLLILQWIKEECRQLRIENQVRMSWESSGYSSGLTPSPTKAASFFGKRSSLVLTAATLSYIKERRLQLSSAANHPCIHEVTYLPPGGTSLVERYRWACSEATKLLRRRLQETLQYDTQVRFFNEETPRFMVLGGLTSGISAPKKPVPPIFFLLTEKDGLRLHVKAQLASNAQQHGVVNLLNPDKEVGPATWMNKSLSDSRIQSTKSGQGQGSGQDGGGTASKGTSNATAADSKTKKLDKSSPLGKGEVKKKDGKPEWPLPPLLVGKGDHGTTQNKTKNKKRKKKPQAPLQKPVVPAAENASQPPPTTARTSVSGPTHPKSPRQEHRRSTNKSASRGPQTDEDYALLLTGKRDVAALKSFLDLDAPSSTSTYRHSAFREDTSHEHHGALDAGPGSPKSVLKLENLNRLREEETVQRVHELFETPMVRKSILPTQQQHQQTSLPTWSSSESRTPNTANGSQTARLPPRPPSSDASYVPATLRHHFRSDSALRAGTAIAGRSAQPQQIVPPMLFQFTPAGRMLRPTPSRGHQAAGAQLKVESDTPLTVSLLSNPSLGFQNKTHTLSL